MGLFERKESVADNDISVEEDLSDLDELDDEPVFGPVIVDDDGDPIDEPEPEPAPEDDFEPAYEFALSTSVFEDGEIGYIVNDHITLSLKLERS